jgi:hypothetical protein
MKTAISIPDQIFEAAEEAAARLLLSRSELYAKAVAEFVEKHGRGDVTERLNQVYTGHAEGLDGAIGEMQWQSIGKDEW